MDAGPVLVTGAAGFAGGHLLELLASRGEQLVAWSRGTPPDALRRLATWDRLDLLNREAVRTAIARVRPSRVYHCAGAPHVAESWGDTAAVFASNVLATHHLVDALRRAAVPARVVVTGSATVYAPSPRPLPESAPLAPASPYAVSKLAQEQLALLAHAHDGVEVIVTRSFNHTGPRQSAGFAAPSMAKQIALIERHGGDGVIRVGNLDAVRDLTDVRDTVRAYAQLMDRGRAGTIYNVASGTGRVIRDILDALVSRARRPVRVEPDPARMRPSDIPVLIGDAGRLRADTGWAPEIPLDRTLDDLLEYWRAQVHAQGDAQAKGQP